MASGEWIVTLDDDLEQSPEDIEKLYAKAREGFDLVYGVYPQRTHSFWRNAASSLARKLFSIAIPKLNVEYTSFRIMRNEISKALNTFDSPFPFIDGYLSWVTNRYATVKVEHGTRKAGRSTYTLPALILHTINIFLTFSVLPLKLASWTGLATFLFGACWFAVILIKKFFGGITVSGYASLMAGIVLFGGLQMFILGIIGEYLGVVNFKTSRKPLYVISQETSQDRQF
jgi:glycosyltransferase involved in cell wall biosynthesis